VTTAILALFLLVTLVLVLRRRSLLLAESPQRHHEPFDGTVHRVGEAAVAARRVAHPRATVIAMHGYVEDMRYFARLYADPSIQLVAIMSCGYHVPVTDAAFEEAAWARAPSAPFGTIAYDAEVLVQALEHLPRSKTIRVHGHSRGGAVVLEASMARPDLFEDVEVVLEAPVLPQAKPFVEANRVMLWFYPLVIAVWKRDPFTSQVRPAFGSLEDPRKRELLSGMPHNPKRGSTFVVNVSDLQGWMRRRDMSAYANVRRGVVLVPSKDRVLDPVSMEASARHAEPALQVVRVEGSSHFVTLDRPDAFPSLLGGDEGERATGTATGE
jgi:pimeloyl-ACP methyl ester carboxylesterase